jgi:hypothetical protein
VFCFGWVGLGWFCWFGVGVGLGGWWWAWVRRCWDGVCFCGGVGKCGWLLGGSVLFCGWLFDL